VVDRLYKFEREKEKKIEEKRRQK